MYLLAVSISVIVGFYAGIFISSIGGSSEIPSLVGRGAILIFPLLGAAIFGDWRWLIVMVAYIFGFHSGYTAFDSLEDGIGSMICGITAILTISSGGIMGSELPVYSHTARSGFQNHPELLWYYDITVLFVSVIAILRHQRQTTRMPNKTLHPTAGNAPV